MKMTISLLFVIFLFCSQYLFSQGITLVKFGSSSSTNTFGLSGWNTILTSYNISYSSLGNSGLLVTSEPTEYSDYRGISGTSRKFSLGERIVVTWYNNSDETISFTSRISFNDNNEPNPDSPDGQWYTMRSFEDYRTTYSSISAHSTAKTVFNICDQGVHKTDDTYSLININLAIEWEEFLQKQNLICEKIELLSDADILPPEKPESLTAEVISDTKIRLSWNQPDDNVGVVEYLIYMDGEVEGYSRSTDYTCVFLEPSKQYRFYVTALDAAGNESNTSDIISATTMLFKGNNSVIYRKYIDYLGAILMPDDFEWGGEAIAYNQDSDGGQSGSGSVDGYPGSFFLTNLNQPENGFVGEVNIPAPIKTNEKNISVLNTATILQNPVNVRPDNINSWSYVDIWRTGLEYVSEEKRLYSSWSIHYTVTSEKHAAISCCDASNLSGSAKNGAWYIGNSSEQPNDAMVADWLFSLPQSWADSYCSGRNLVTGRCRDGGLSGLGPTLYAFKSLSSSIPQPNSNLDITTLLQYGSVEGTDNYNFPNSIDGYKHSDDWRGAVWLSSFMQNAIAFVGNKALGNNWYGYTGEKMRHDWVIADVPYPDFYSTDPDGKGWRSHNRQPMIILFDPVEIGNVAKGIIKSYEPQPYAALRIDKNIFFGSGHEIFSATFDSQNKILYITEFLRDLDGKLVLHAFRVNDAPVSVPINEKVPMDYKLYQNYPNPFNPSTRISYRLPFPGYVTLKIYDVIGREIKTLIDEYQTCGEYTVNFNINGSSSGIYFYTLRAGDFSQTKKMTMIW
jgi:hypothetical protein